MYPHSLPLPLLSAPPSCPVASNKSHLSLLRLLTRPYVQHVGGTVPFHRAHQADESLGRRVTISITAPTDTPEHDLLTLDLPAGMTTSDLKALIQSDTNFPPDSQHLYHNGQLLTENSKTMEELGIGDGEMLAMHVRDMVGETGVPSVGRALGSRASPHGARGQGGPPTRAPAGGGGGPDPEVVRLRILGAPHGREEVRNRNPELADAVEDPDRFRQVFQEMQRKEAQEDRERQREIAKLNDDPFNPEAQAKIEELIRQEAVMENLQYAWEFNPEGQTRDILTFGFVMADNPFLAFGKVYMLYIDVEVNSHKVKAFVDSGAQATIMSPSCAEACGIMRLVDKRFAGIARGVGTAEIVGRVHNAQIKIGTMYLDSSFTVMEGKAVDLLLGLDMLKRHQACIDLRRDKLVIKDVEVPFLGEADIPRNQEDRLNEPTVEGPGSTKVGARSGAVLQAGNPTPAAMGHGSSATPSSQSGNFQGQGQSLGPRPGPVHPESQAPQQAQAPSAPTYPAEAIAQLQQLGFSREEAIAALNATGGNVDYAAGLLFQER